MYLKIYLVYLVCLPVCSPAMTAPSTIKEWWQDNGETSLSSYGDKHEISPCLLGGMRLVGDTGDRSSGIGSYDL